MQNNFPKIPLFLSLIFFVFSSFAFSFLYREIKSNNNKSQLATEEWQMEKTRRDEIRSLDHSIKIIEKERAQLETHFAQSSDIVPFLDAIEALGLKMGIQIEIVSVNILPEQAGLLVGMKTTGDFENLYKFLTLLENFPYELEFVSIDMRKGTRADASGRSVPASFWEAVLKMKLLSFVE